MKYLLSFYVLLFYCISSNIQAQRGYYDAPYLRYEADLGTLTNGATTTSKSYAQTDLQSEASDQKCVTMNTANASVSWNLTAAADGLVVRYSIPDGQTASLAVYNGNALVTNLFLTTTWSWESLWNNGNPNNVAVVNQNPKMRFDEIRYKLPTPIAAGGSLKLVRVSGNISLDFAELEAVPAAITAPVGAAVFSGNGTTLQAFINSHGGQTIYVPAGEYILNSELYFGVANTKLIGAGMWYTHLNFVSTIQYNGGLRANAAGIGYSDLYLTTTNASRSGSYKGINGVYTATSTIKNIWAEHFECGAWIAQYASGGPTFADGFTLSGCRFRNNYADGINLCKGTSNAIVEHCNFRNNGDDDQAIWCADGLECINNTFRYNTSENCWRASGVAFYGGKNNKAYNLIIKDNVESGIRLSNNFNGVGFNASGMNEFYDITIIGAGTQNDLFNQRVGAIDIYSASNAGTQVRNVRFTNIDIIDSKCDGILLQKKGGDGLYNFGFENITINGTGKEYPNNNINGVTTPKGFFTAFSNFPNGNATYCNMFYSNRGGTATTDEYLVGLGTFSWSQLPNCIVLETEKMEVESLSVYPNPVAHLLVIENSEINDTVSIFDISGKLVIEKSVASAQENIDVSQLESGIYLLTLKNNNRTRTSKFIKQ